MNMMTIVKTDQERTEEVQEFSKGCWVHLCNPDESELNAVTEYLGVEPDWVRAALDEEERARIETDNADYRGHTDGGGGRAELCLQHDSAWDLVHGGRDRYRYA